MKDSLSVEQLNLIERPLHNSAREAEGKAARKGKEGKLKLEADKGGLAGGWEGQKETGKERI